MYAALEQASCHQVESRLVSTLDQASEHAETYAETYVNADSLAAQQLANSIHNSLTIICICISLSPILWSLDLFVIVPKVLREISALVIRT